MKELYPHNQEAYRKIIDAYKTNEKAAIVHATGTGKSYVIAEVCKHFNNVLIIAPNKYVIEETNKLIPNAQFQTYASLMVERNRHRGYDLIVLDEFHRTGAEKWGESLNLLLEMNKGAKILGTSATNIRYLDGMRDMADEIFENNVVSKLTLSDALKRGILPMPIYVTGLYTIDDIKNSYRTRIENSKLNLDDKRKQLELLRYITRSWKQSYGVQHIINKYFAKDMKKIIVFVSSVEKARSIINTLKKWLSEAGFDNVSFYNVDSYDQRKSDRNMAEFRKPCNDGELKVAVSVNMLNEGIHVQDIDSIIMLRTTASRIILEQQIGRCLTADNKRKAPVILDLVNNMELIDYDYNVSSFKGTGLNKHQKRDTETEQIAFEVIDECKEIRELLFNLDEKLPYGWTKELVIEEAKKYSFREDFKKKSYSAYSWSRYHNCYEEVCAHMDRPRKVRTDEELIDEARKYTTLAELRNNDYNTLQTLRKRGLIDKALKFLKRVNAQPLTIEDVIAAAKDSESAKDMEQRYPTAYSKMRKKGWKSIVQGLCPHIKSSRNSWTVDNLIKAAKGCKSYKEFTHKYQGAPPALRKEGVGEKVFKACPQIKPRNIN